MIKIYIICLEKYDDDKYVIVCCHWILVILVVSYCIVSFVSPILSLLCVVGISLLWCILVFSNEQVENSKSGQVCIEYIE